MFEFSLNKQIELNSLIQLLFNVDNGNDDPCTDMLDLWLNDDELVKKLKNESSSWTVSPDLGAFDLKIINNKIVLIFEAGIMTEDGDVIADIGKFYIDIGKSNIYKFIFYSDTLDDLN